MRSRRPRRWTRGGRRPPRAGRRRPRRQRAVASADRLLAPASSPCPTIAPAVRVERRRRAPPRSSTGILIEHPDGGLGLAVAGDDPSRRPSGRSAVAGRAARRSPSSTPTGTVDRDRRTARRGRRRSGGGPLVARLRRRSRRGLRTWWCARTVVHGTEPTSAGPPSTPPLTCHLQGPRPNVRGDRSFLRLDTRRPRRLGSDAVPGLRLRGKEMTSPMLNRPRTWLAAPGAILLVLAVSGAVLGASVLTVAGPAPEEVTDPLVVDTRDLGGRRRQRRRRRLPGRHGRGRSGSGPDRARRGRRRRRRRDLRRRRPPTARGSVAQNCNHGGFVSFVAQRDDEATEEEEPRSPRRPRRGRSLRSHRRRALRPEPR